MLTVAYGAGTIAEVLGRSVVVVLPQTKTRRNEGSASDVSYSEEGGIEVV